MISWSRFYWNRKLTISGLWRCQQSNKSTWSSWISAIVSLIEALSCSTGKLERRSQPRFHSCLGYRCHRELYRWWGNRDSFTLNGRGKWPLSLCFVIPGIGTDSKLNPVALKSLSEVLRKYVDTVPELELHALFAAQALVTHRQHPKGQLSFTFVPVGGNGKRTWWHHWKPESLWRSFKLNRADALVASNGRGNAMTLPFVVAMLTGGLLDVAGLIQGIFEMLYDSNVVSEEGFETWVNSDDPSERDGKAVALKSLTSFLTWLKEADPESDPEESVG